MVALLNLERRSSIDIGTPFMYIKKMRVSYKSITVGYQLTEPGALPGTRSNNYETEII